MHQFAYRGPKVCVGVKILLKNIDVGIMASRSNDYTLDLFEYGRP